MYCLNCGTNLSEDARFCLNCGSAVQQPMQQSAYWQPDTDPYQSMPLAGFSHRINDPSFARYIKNSNRWAAIFSFVMAIVAVVGFFIDGESSLEMGNPVALFIGLGIGAMFIIIALFQIIGRNRSKTWDGVVIDKKNEHKRRRQNFGNDEYLWEDYTLFTVFIRSESGKVHRLSVENDDTRYNHFQAGDRVRHHGRRILIICHEWKKKKARPNVQQR